MTGKKRILIVCGTAITTSTMVAMKVEDLLKKHGLHAEIRRALTSEAKVKSKDADLIIATTQVPSVEVPVISGIPFITGIGVDKVELLAIAEKEIQQVVALQQLADLFQDGVTLRKIAAARSSNEVYRAMLKGAGA